MSEKLENRIVFDEVADLYDEVRPRYPTALFDSLVEAAHLPARAKLLEIGPGTGLATGELARRGFEILGVEIGPRLANLARRNLRDFPNVRVVTAPFEDIDLPSGTFDLVYAATSFHWIDPKLRFTKPHRILNSNGHLAVIHTEHVWGDHTDSLFEKTKPIYDQYLPPDDPNTHLSSATQIKPYEFDGSLFKSVFFSTFPTTVKYSSEDYVQLINTFSPTRAMDPHNRELFLKAIQDLIDKHFGGAVTKHFAMTLNVAKKNDG